VFAAKKGLGAANFRDADEDTMNEENILMLFDCRDMDAALHPTARAFQVLASYLAANLPESEARSRALSTLLEAKNQAMLALTMGAGIRH
jgi:hypothetical protein